MSRDAFIVMERGRNTDLFWWCQFEDCLGTPILMMSNEREQLLCNECGREFLDDEAGLGNRTTRRIEETPTATAMPRHPRRVP